MPCSCKGKNARRTASTSSKGASGASNTSGSTQSFTLTDRTGRTQTFGSKLEAEAANRRRGGTGKIS
jgi:hypothetical protein